jgi:hypothetical protein
MAVSVDDAITSLRTVLGTLSGELTSKVMAYLQTGHGMDPELLIKAMKSDLPTLIDTYAAAAADYSVQWYNDLAPDEPFKATGYGAGAQIIDESRVFQTIEWAVHTGAKGAALTDEIIQAIGTKLTGSTERMVYDASRRVVQWNAEDEKVKYARVARPGACPWCRLMAIRGAVYTSASNAIKGHDSCHCIALPERKGVKFNKPAYYDAWENEYVQATKDLKAEDKTPNLSNVLAKFEKNDKAAADKKVTDWLAAEKDFNKKEAKKAAQAKYVAKKKAQKEQDTKDWLAAEAKHKEDVSKWLIAESQFKAEDAAALAKKEAKKQAQAKYMAKKKAEKEAAAAAAAKPANLGTAPTANIFGLPPAVDELIPTGQVLGSHGAQVYESQDFGDKWLVKPQNHYRNLLDEATAKLQAKLGLTTPDTFTLKVAGKESSVQKWFTGTKTLPEDPSALSQNDIFTLQKHQALDWLTSNHDSHASNFLRTEDGQIIGIDKGQAFKWFGKDKLAWDFHPNAHAHPPLYNAMWQNWIDGKFTKATMMSPTAGDFGAFLKTLQDIPDDELKTMFRPFAEAAAKAGKLANGEPAPGLLLNAKVPPNDVDAFLTQLVARKNNIVNDFDALFTKAQSLKTGTPKVSVPTPPASTPTPSVVPTGEIEISKQFAQADMLALAKQHQIADPNASDVVTAYVDQWSVIDSMTNDFYAQSPAFKPYSPAKPGDSDTVKALHANLLELATKANDLQKQGIPIASNGFVTQYKYLKTLSPKEYAEQFPDTVQKFTLDWQAKQAAAYQQKIVTPAPAANPFAALSDLEDAWNALDAETKKKVGKQLAAVKHTAKKNGDTALYDQYDAMTPKLYYGFKNNIGQAAAPAGPTDADWHNAWKALSFDDKKKAGKQLAAKKHQAKKKGDTTLFQQYDQMSTFDYWKSTQTSINVPTGGTVNVPPPVKSPPTDPVKLQKIADLEAQYKAAKPTGTGFTPIKGLHPELSVKNGLEAFHNEIGVGYLTDDQLLQALTKQPAAAQKKYLKLYADAKGQPAANAVQAKLPKNTYAGGGTSSGVSPSYYSSSFDPSTVMIKPGTLHTPDRPQKTAVAKKLLTTKANGEVDDMSKALIPDINAPVGSADNPHVFTMADSNDYQTWGAMHTEQDKSKWPQQHKQGVGYAGNYTGSTYTQINGALRKGDEKHHMVQAFDALFHSDQVKPTEDWMIIARATGRREFNNNETGIKFDSSASHVTPEDFKHLVGKNYTTDSYLSSGITVERAYGKPIVRVIQRIPPGSRMLWVSGEPGTNKCISVQGQSEREIIGPRKQEFKVIGFRKSTDPNYQVDAIVELVKQHV